MAIIVRTCKECPNNQNDGDTQYCTREDSFITVWDLKKGVAVFCTLPRIIE